MELSIIGTILVISIPVVESFRLSISFYTQIFHNLLRSKAFWKELNDENINMHDNKEAKIYSEPRKDRS
jgi:hypothetical protein